MCWHHILILTTGSAVYAFLFFSFVYLWLIYVFIFHFIDIEYFCVWPYHNVFTHFESITSNAAMNNEINKIDKEIVSTQKKLDSTNAEINSLNKDYDIRNTDKFKEKI